ncbi:sulfonate ABC transporter substrate-binding protein [Alkalihalobacillus pseudalcaliphilus]|uniref:sulfonate ABC transporter substrate-binding protein n=1 Tax=Alkalihalobacillus pseudalcaliphilus TaxID=79884 RepID=UPI00064DB644|nr:sulfonate ABC transporter substrate-binding protein [Alkalihalobacillus pseudalcaliphilus]KMK76730.1 ABC transporter substrate-binding protein [Alkalihalobacillus pseudalcaliphilus]
MRLIRFLTLLVGVMLIGGCQATSSSSEEITSISIGYQKFGTLNILKAEGALEERLEELDIDVEWHEFPAGPQLLEALNGGSIDFGHTGEAPPIFSQAANAPLIYIGNGPGSPKGEAVIVQNDSDIQEVTELKGRKVALNRGSNVHYLLVKVLEESGLTLDDIEVVYLPPADARIAFDRGDVDAWVIWDPFYAEAEVNLEARVLRDGTDLVANREFLLAEENFAKNHDDVIEVILEELRAVEIEAEANIEETAAFLAPEVNIEQAILKKVLERRGFGIKRITDDVKLDQQEIGDIFFELELIPEAIDINDVVLPK